MGGRVGTINGPSILGRVAAGLIAPLIFAAETAAAAGTLEELLERERAVASYACPLQPRPALEATLAGTALHAVVPSRFPNPGIWGTSTLLLAAAEGNQVRAVAELAIPGDLIAPRDVVEVTCGSRRLTVRISDRVYVYTYVYGWNGQNLSFTRRTKQRK